MRVANAGTMALNLWPHSRVAWKEQAEREQGWHIASVTDYAQLIAFARDFSRQHYGHKSKIRGAAL
jgi:hypothetical protein